MKKYTATARVFKYLSSLSFFNFDYLVLKKATLWYKGNFIVFIIDVWEQVHKN